MKTRAPKGGSKGVNGENYKGGRFLPSNPERPKVEGSKPRRPLRTEIEPGVFVETVPGIVGIYAKINAACTFEGGKLHPLPESSGVWTYLARGGDLVAVRASVVRAANAYNAGERLTLAGV